MRLWLIARILWWRGRGVVRHTNICPSCFPSQSSCLDSPWAITTQQGWWLTAHPGNATGQSCLRWEQHCLPGAWGSHHIPWETQGTPHRSCCPTAAVCLRVRLRQGRRREVCLSLEHWLRMIYLRFSVLWEKGKTCTLVGRQNWIYFILNMHWLIGCLLGQAQKTRVSLTGDSWHWPLHFVSAFSGFTLTGIRQEIQPKQNVSQSSWQLAHLYQHTEATTELLRCTQFSIFTENTYLKSHIYC